jgi:phospholipid transport system substrate-binding protein
MSRARSSFITAACLIVPMTPASAADTASAAIDHLDSGLVTAMKNGSTPFQQRYAALAPVVDATFNLQQILQTTIGLKWASIPADKQKALLAAFRAFTIASYVANFDSDSGTTFRIRDRPQGWRSHPHGLRHAPIPGRLAGHRRAGGRHHQPGRRAAF